MKLDEITQIMQTNDPDEVNRLLAKGYKLVKILSNKVSTPLGDEVRPIYILGLGLHRNLQNHEKQ